MPVNFLSSAFVVNVGDILEVFPYSSHWQQKIIIINIVGSTFQTLAMHHFQT